MKNPTMIFTLGLMILSIAILAIFIRYNIKMGQEKMANEEVKSNKVTFLYHRPIL